MQVRQQVKCDWCEQWTDKEIDSTFSRPIFKLPTRWLFLWDSCESRELAFCCGNHMMWWVERYVSKLPENIRIGK